MTGCDGVRQAAPGCPGITVPTGRLNEAAVPGVRAFEPKWRAAPGDDENYVYAIAL
jgi:hypothetical protein